LALEQCNFDTDIQLFLDASATGSHVAEPMSYTPFAQNVDYVNMAGLNVETDTLSDSQSSASVRPNGKTTHQFAFQAPPTTERSFMYAGNETEIMESTFLYDPFDVPADNAVLFTVRVMYDYKSQAKEELDIRKDQLIPVIATHEDG
jgi:hypothetical protein